MSKEILSEVLGPRDARELWSSGYSPVLPIKPGDFALGSVLPAVLYLMRWGHRRGRGPFVERYGKHATINHVAAELGTGRGFSGWTGEVEKSILGDLLLSYVLENKAHRPGREEPVQRVFPCHYLSSWVDLPEEFTNLRAVPELFTVMLARQMEGERLAEGNGFYRIRRGIEQNLLLSIFGSGTTIQGQPDSLTSDEYDEQVRVGLDQLLTIRLALSLGKAPPKVKREDPSIPNQLPICSVAADNCFEDLNVFLRAYGRIIPRQSLLPMLESCLGLHVLTVYLGAFALVLEWGNAGCVPNKTEERPWPLFVDCSTGLDQRLRRCSEECIDDLLQRLHRLPAHMMALLILEQWARQERMPGMPPSAPFPTERVNVLGGLLCGRHGESASLERDLRKKCNRLAEALRDQDEAGVVPVLENATLHPVWRMAEAIVAMMGRARQARNYIDLLDGCLMSSQPNGIGRKRRSIVKGRMLERRSLVLTNVPLDFLVHRHLRSPNKGTRPRPLSFDQFVNILRDRYGLYVDRVPPGMSIAAELLAANRAYLERRLRDLGLLLGVNDAESMKQLRTRFQLGEDGDE
jgi:hypothetical protein